MKPTARLLIQPKIKIADITHADTNEHTKTCADLGVPKNTKALIIIATRASGTGSFKVLSGTGGTYDFVASNRMSIWVKEAAGTFRYQLTIANDDWDISMVGIFIEQDEPESWLP